MQSRRSFIKYIIGLLLGLFGIKYKPTPKFKWSVKNYDYTNNEGVCVGTIYSKGGGKVIFNNKDYGVIAINAYKK